MDSYNWKCSNYKQMEGRWKIGVITEAGYKISDIPENQSELEKITDRIYFRNFLLPYPESEQLSGYELELWRRGIELVSEQIEVSQPAKGYIIIALKRSLFSVCDMQEEAFTASAIKWAADMFGFSMPFVNVTFDGSIPPYGRYVYDFSKLAEKYQTLSVEAQALGVEAQTLSIKT